MNHSYFLIQKCSQTYGIKISICRISSINDRIEINLIIVSTWNEDHKQISGEGIRTVLNLYEMKALYI